MKPKLRVSYSLLNMWKRGQHDEAIKSYLHLPTPTSLAMEDGIMWDTHITEWVDLYKLLPKEFGGDKLKNPQTQPKFTIPYNDLWDLVIQPDILDEDILWENKTGSSKDSGDYAIDFQVSIYLFALDKLKSPINRAIINHYNQYEETLDRALIWKSPQELRRAKNFIDSIAPEVYEYFDTHEIFDKSLKIVYNS